MPEINVYEALNELPLPLVIVTTGNKEKAGMTAAWITQVSWKPAYVGIAIYNKWSTLKVIKNLGYFAINIVSPKLLKVALKVFGSLHSEAVDKFLLASRDYGVKIGLGKLIKAPVILESPLIIECRVAKILEIGDHHLVVGEPLTAYRNADEEPIVFRKNKFFLATTEVENTTE